MEKPHRVTDNATPLLGYGIHPEKKMVMNEAMYVFLLDNHNVLDESLLKLLEEFGKDWKVQ